MSVIHVDLKGPITPCGVEGEKYILGIVDVYSHYIYHYYLKSKDEASDFIERFITEHVTYISKLWLAKSKTDPIKKIELLLSQVVSDQGGEFISDRFRRVCTSFGVQHTVVPAYGPQLNSRIESTWKYIFRLVRTLLLQSNIQTRYWPYADHHAVYLMNMTRLYTVKVYGSNRKARPMRATPHQLLYQEVPNIKHIRQFGCLVHYFIPEALRNNANFSVRSKQGKLIGFLDSYPNRHTAVVVTEESYSKIKPEILLVDRDNCRYVETQISSFNIFNGEPVFSDDIPEEDDTEPTEQDESDSDIDTHQSNNKVRIISSPQDNPIPVAFASPSSSADTPSLQEALRGPEAVKWIEAIKTEFAAIEKNNVWKLVELPINRKALNTRWVLKKKFDVIRQILIYKGRLVVKGFQAIDGEDYIAILTYAPVAKMPSLRIFLSIVTQFGMYLVQIDVDTAFQMAQLEEEIYIKIPEVFEQIYGLDMLRGFTNPVLLLLRALYGLPQSPKAWFKRIDGVLKKLDYIPLNNEPCLYKKVNSNGIIISLTILYVDDMLIANTSQSELKNIITSLKTEFQVKVNWEPTKILGVNLQYDRCRGHTVIHQKDKINDLEELLQLNHNDRVNLPMMPIEPSADWVKKNVNDTLLNDDEASKYRTILGKLMYIMTSTRPDICFAVSVFSRFSQNPTKRQLQGIYQTVKYRIATEDKVLTFQRQPFQLYRMVAYSDADWATDHRTRRSQTGGIILLAGTPIIWMSSQQSTVALSSTEAEINALRSVTKQVLWVRNIMKELAIFPNINMLKIPILQDNTSAIQLVHNPAVNSTNRHTDISHKFVTENILEFGTISVDYVPTQHNIADVFTKIPKADTFDRLTNQIFNLFKNPLGTNII